MTLATPRYIIDAQIEDANLKYEWDDWRLQEIFVPEDEAFHERMSGVSLRANIAFTNACCEWIVHRYDLLSDDPQPLDHIEASWAGVVDPTYSLYWEPLEDDWKGPVRRPLFLSIVFTLEAKIDAYNYTDPARSADYASNLADHIITDPQPFRQWREAVVQRLEHLYPLDEDDALGDVVPREALDPDRPFRPDMTEQLVQKFLSGLDSQNNRFLLSAEEMIEAGFKGTPYQFDIEADRIARNDY